jgi:hypothetical protein
MNVRSTFYVFLSTQKGYVLYIYHNCTHSTSFRWLATTYVSDIRNLELSYNVNLPKLPV